MFTYKLVHDIVQMKELVKKMKAFKFVWEIPVILWIKETIITQFSKIFHIFIIVGGFYKPHITFYSQHMNMLPLTQANLLIWR